MFECYSHYSYYSLEKVVRMYPEGGLMYGRFCEHYSRWNKKSECYIPINKSNGSSLTVTVQETLIKNYSCNYISQGQLYLQGSFLDGFLDYGNNNCDNQATYTRSDGSVYNVNL